jgi:hypothetical protein
MDQRNFTYLVYGLVAAWLILLIYLISLAARERRIKEDLARVRRMVEEGQPKDRT